MRAGPARSPRRDWRRRESRRGGVNAVGGPGLSFGERSSNVAGSRVPKRGAGRNAGPGHAVKRRRTVGRPAGAAGSAPARARRSRTARRGRSAACPARGRGPLIYRNGGECETSSFDHFQVRRRFAMRTFNRRSRRARRDFAVAVALVNLAVRGHGHPAGAHGA